VSFSIVREERGEERGQAGFSFSAENTDLKARLERPLFGEMQAGRFTASESDNTVDSAEKGLSMLRHAQHERKIVNVIDHLPVRPELVEG
jgi:hypothetical protein